MAGREVGCLGDIIFSVSEETVQTLNNMTWSGSAAYATHQRHLNDALTEFVGRNPDTIKFDIRLSYYLGSDVMAEINKIWDYERNGIPVPLNIGTKGYGKYRWLIVQHDILGEDYFGNGDLCTANVSISLVEYLLS